VERASRLRSWIVKIADLYAAFIAAQLTVVTNVKSKLFRRQQRRRGLPGPTFSKSRARSLPFVKIFRCFPWCSTRDAATHGVQTIASGKDFHPTGGPRGFICVCLRTPSHGTRRSGALRLLFPGRRRKNMPQPLCGAQRKDLDF